MAIRNVAAVGIRVRPDTETTGKELRAKLAGMEKDNKLNIPVQSDLEKRSGKTRFAERLKTDLGVIQERLDKGAAALRVKVVPNKAADTIDTIRDSVRRTNEAIDKQGIAFRVPVKADAKAIKSSIKNALKQVERELATEDPVRVRIAVDVATLKRQWEKLKEDLSGDDIELKAELDRKARVKQQLAELARNRVVTLAVRVSAASLAQAKTTLAALSGLGLITDTGRGLRNFIDNIDTYAIKLGKVGVLTGTLTTGILSLTSALHGLGAGLASMGAFVLAAPAIFGAAAAFIAIQVAAFKNFKTAVEGDTAALDALPKKAAAAARALTGTWTSVQQPVQIAYWERLGTVVQDFVRDILPEFRDGMTKVASEAGGMTQQLLRSFTRLSGKKVFSSIFTDMSKGLGLATLGVQPFMSGIIELTRQGGRYLPEMGKYLKDAADTFGDWVRRSSEAGKITMWIDNARESARNLGQSLRSITGIFSSIVDSTGTSANLEGLAGALERVRRLVAGPVFQDGMAILFTGAREAMGEFQQGIGNLLGSLSKMAPVLATILVTTGSVVNNLLSGIAGSIQRPAFQQGLLNFFGGIDEGVQGFLTNLPRLADGIGSLGSLVGTVFGNVLPVVGEMLGTLSDLFRQLQPSLVGLVPTMSNLVLNGFQALAVIFVILLLMLSRSR